jgi:hypothetical protein
MASIKTILAQLPKTPKVLEPVAMPVSKLMRTLPEDALAIVSRNVPAVFGPKARTVTFRVLNGLTPTTDSYATVDIFYLVFDDLDPEISFRDIIRTETEYKKATLRRLGPDEDIRDAWLDEDVSGPLAFESEDVFRDKMTRGELIEMTDDVGTYILCVGMYDGLDEDFFFFHPHEPLVVTFVQ